MKRIKIKVTAKDIRQGKPLDATCCPIALACRRIPVFKGALVEDEAVCTEDDYFSLPLRAVRFVDNFDHGKPVKPFTFTVPMPYEYEP